jgi:hypothetical protein
LAVNDADLRKLKELEKSGPDAARFKALRIQALRWYHRNWPTDDKPGESHKEWLSRYYDYRLGLVPVPSGPVFKRIPVIVE